MSPKEKSVMHCAQLKYFFSFVFQLFSPGCGGWNQRQGWQLAVHSFCAWIRPLCRSWVVQGRNTAGGDGNNGATYSLSRTTQRDSGKHPGSSRLREVSSTTSVFLIYLNDQKPGLWGQQPLKSFSCAIFWSGPRSCVFTPSNFTSQPNRENSRRCCSCWVC